LRNPVTHAREAPYQKREPIHPEQQRRETIVDLEKSKRFVIGHWTLLSPRGGLKEACAGRKGETANVRLVFTRRELCRPINRVKGKKGKGIFVGKKKNTPSIGEDPVILEERMGDSQIQKKGDGRDHTLDRATGRLGKVWGKGVTEILGG